jgi:ribose transport system substrate-binding protein
VQGLWLNPENVHTLGHARPVLAVHSQAPHDPQRSAMNPLRRRSAIQRLLLCSTLLTGLLASGRAEAGPPPLRYVLIPKLSHPWFEGVRRGALEAATMIQQQSRRTAVIDYRPPATADVAQQAAILEEAIRSRPNGISIDLLDADQLKPLLAKAQRQGIALNVFDSEAPAGLPLTSIGNDFCEQARIASKRLVQLLNGQGEVAIMQGVPTAPNHAIRAKCHQEVFAKHPNIRVVASPIDYDSISVAEQQAVATMQRYPELKGWVVSDAGGGIGVGQALQKMGKTGLVKVVGLDDLPELLQMIRSGVVDSSAATKPRSQGYWAVLNLWQQSLGAPGIERIDTGIGVERSPERLN